MKLEHYKTEYVRGIYYKDFTVVATSMEELTAFLHAFDRLKENEEPDAQQAMYVGRCPDEESDTRYTDIAVVKGNRDDIVELTAIFKKLYKAAKAEARSVRA
tara:strand:+ start:2711 stop:3016 length:306 start_codon:yes stop_codon:yes gene_type:complete